MASDVQAVCDWFGPTDLTRMNDHPGAIDHDAADSPESQLVGGPIQSHRDRVAAANPITYVSGDEPPFLIMHGMRDTSVPYQQSQLLHEALVSAGVSSTIHLLPEAGHGGNAFAEPGVLEIVYAFFGRHLF